MSGPTRPSARPVRSRRLAVWAGLVALAAAAPAASAYCADPDRGDDFGVSIPVYVTTSGPRDVSLLGLTDAAVVGAVISQLEIYNHSAADVPRLYYAGALSADTSNWNNVPANAITVMSEGAGCGVCGPGSAAACWQPSGTKHRVTLRPVGCPGAGQFAVDDLVSRVDLFGVLLHELGHALGLGHPDHACPGAWVSSAGDYGIMRSQAVTTSAGRRLRRDDVFGLMAIYGMRQREVAARESTDGGATWSAPAPIVPGLTTRAPVRASAAGVALSSPIRAIGFAEGVWGSVGVVTGTWSGWDGGGGFDLVDGGSLVDGVAVAVGRNAGGVRKVMAAWYADESVDALDGNLRWGLKSYTGAVGGWSLYNGSDQDSKVVGLGFDDEYRRFVVTTMDQWQRPVIHTIDPDTGAIVATTNLHALQPGVVRDTVGGAACYRDGALARCVVPFTSSTTSGPCLGWYELQPDVGGTFTLLATESTCATHSYGPTVSLAADPRATGSFGFLQSHDITAASALFLQRADTLARDAGGGITPTPASTLFEATRWPFAIGAMSRARTPTSTKYQIVIGLEP